LFVRSEFIVVFLGEASLQAAGQAEEGAKSRGIVAAGRRHRVRARRCYAPALRSRA
jgi:hypothetical protein